MKRSVLLPPRAAFDRLSAALDELLDRDEAARDTWLVELGAAEPELEQELRRHLALLDVEGPLERPVLGMGGDLSGDPDRELDGDPDGDLDVPDTSRAGERVGPFRLGGEIGRGGMGTVYAADRVEGGFAQAVAVKIVKRGLDTDEVLVRFAAERRILARLEHPGIARLIDGGVTTDGLPWFAMERIEGRPMLEAARERGLPLRARLELFVEAADAVAFAHRKLVVHRDLKSSNILVDARGAVKLLDFGIAKVVAGESADPGQLSVPADHQVLTRASAYPMTPAFAAPEQLRGEVSTLTDVYQLGRLLGELVPRPRPVDIARIVAMASHELPERRYPSVEAFAADVRRWLAGRPVVARGDSALYQVARFVRRHRMAVGASSLALAALVAALAIALVQARRARLEASRAVVVQDFLVGLFEASSPSEARGRDPRASELLAAAPQKIERELAGRPELAAGLLEVIGRIHVDLGNFAAGEAIFLEAIAKREEMAKRRGMPSADAERLARDYADLADLRVWASDFAGADAALTAAERLTSPGGKALDAAQTRVLSVRAMARLRSGRPAEAEALVREVLARLEREGRQEEEVYYARLNDYALAVQNQGRMAEAEPILRRVLAWSEAHPTPDELNRASDLANLGTLLNRMNKDVEAEKYLRAAIEIRHRVLPPSFVATLVNQRVLATLLVSQGRLGEAATLLDEALRLEIEARGDGSREVALIERVRARVDGERGDWESAGQRLGRARAVLNALPGGPDIWALRTDVDLARAELESGGPASARRAESAVREALARQRAAAVAAGDLNKALTLLARALAAEGRVTEALAAAHEAVASAREAWGERHLDVALALAALAEAQSLGGDAAAALVSLESADRVLAALAPGGAAVRPVVEAERAAVWLRSGRRDEALVAARRALELRSTQAGVEAPVTRRLASWIASIESIS